MTGSSLKGRKIPYKRRLWSARQVRQLQNLSGQLCLDEVARMIGRTTEAVELKLKKLGFYQHYRAVRDGWFTEKEACEILGVSSVWLQSRARLGYLVMKPHDRNKPPRKGNSCPWHISEKSLKIFVKKYPQELEGKPVNAPLLIALLEGRLAS